MIESNEELEKAERELDQFLEGEAERFESERKERAARWRSGVGERSLGDRVIAFAGYMHLLGAAVSVLGFFINVGGPKASDGSWAFIVSLLFLLGAAIAVGVGVALVKVSRLPWPGPYDSVPAMASENAEARNLSMKMRHILQ